MNAVGTVMRSIFGAALSLGALVALLPPPSAAAEPVELKYAFFASEATDAYRFGIKPFVDAVNAEGQGIVSIKVYSDGKLGKSLAEQPQMVLNGIADIAWVVPGQTPYRFPDNEALELPGQFRNLREATLVYTKLVTAGALRGYGDFVVIAAFGTAPGAVHSRNPINSIADLGGLKIRTNNAIEAEALTRLGAIPTVMPASMVPDALTRGTIDASILSPAGLFQFGAPAVTKNHYLLSTGTAPLVILMNRQRFEGLPKAAQDLIRKHSGAHAAATWIQFYGDVEQHSLEQIKSDPEHKTVEPSSADREAARRAYETLIQSFAAKAPQNRKLVEMIAAELSAIRSSAR